MRVIRICFSACFILAASTFLQAQSPAPFKRNQLPPPDALRNSTTIYSEVFDVIDTPTHLMQVKLAAACQGTKILEPPRWINLTLWSGSRKSRYEKGKDRNLVATTDGESWVIGTLGYLPLRGRTSFGEELFFRWPTGPGIDLKVPKTAQVRGSKGVEGLIMEGLFIDIKPEQFLKIARAKKVEFQLGDTKFEFAENQMNMIRDFVSRIKL